VPARTRIVNGSRGTKPNARSLARRLALQALYQMSMTGDSANEVCTQFAALQDMKGVDRKYFEMLLRGVEASRDDLLAMLAPHLDRKVEQLDPVERSILLIGSYELVNCIDVPFRVAINEAIELARTFGASEGHRYVNSILDRVARIHRVTEKRG
jgi:N utilization substance protein B